MPKTIYVCEYCRTIYEKRMDARWCEIQHEQRDGYIGQNDCVKKALRREGSNPCDYCGRAYYVYGSEFNCECEPKCKNYSLFLAKEIVEKDARYLPE